MNPDKRPVSVTVLAGLYLAVGAIGFAYHFHDLLTSPAEGFWIELTESLAFICGVFLLRGDNRARWGALAWIAFHVVLSIFHPVREFAIHCLFLAVFAWVLFRPEAARYFHRRDSSY